MHIMEQKTRVSATYLAAYLPGFKVNYYFFAWSCVLWWEMLESHCVPPSFSNSSCCSKSRFVKKIIPGKKCHDFFFFFPFCLSCSSPLAAFSSSSLLLLNRLTHVRVRRKKENNWPDFLLSTNKFIHQKRKKLRHPGFPGGLPSKY